MSRKHHDKDCPQHGYDRPAVRHGRNLPDCDCDSRSRPDVFDPLWDNPFAPEFYDDPVARDLRGEGLFPPTYESYGPTPRKPPEEVSPEVEARIFVIGIVIGLVCIAFWVGLIFA